MATTLLFDVDGVLTDEHAQLDHALVAKIAAITKTMPVAFITGRSRSWLEVHLLPSLRRSLPEIHVPAIRLAAEMGALRSGASTDYSWEIAQEHAVPSELRVILERLPKERSLTDLIEWDATKEATATFESLHRPEIAGHAARARTALAELLPECEELATKWRCRAALSTYALDVLAQSLSKRVGAEFGLRGVPMSDRVLVFGDSPGDLAMASFAHEHGYHDVTFAWVGRGLPPEAGAFPVVSSALPHAAGTTALLRTLLEV